MPRSSEPVERPLGEGGDRGGPLVVVDLGVGEPRAVVDERVHELEAGALRVLCPVAGDGVAGPLTKRAWRLVSMCSRLPGQGHS